MKFGKVLKTSAEEMPEMGDLFLRYKELKRQLKLIQPSDIGAEAGGNLAEVHETTRALVEEYAGSAEPSCREGKGDGDQQPAVANWQNTGLVDVKTEGTQALTAEEQAFLQTLREDLDKFNDFFMEKEEEFIIRSQALEDKLEGQTDKTQLRRIRKQFTDLHGELVLVLHWSLLNYTSVVKILKKHDKRSGVLLKQPLLASVLKQPFYSTGRITTLVKQAEAKSQLLLAQEEEAEVAGSNTEYAQSLREHAAELSKRTRSALEMWEEMGAKASTPSTVMPVAKRQKRDDTAGSVQEPVREATEGREERSMQAGSAEQSSDVTKDVVAQSR